MSRRVCPLAAFLVASAGLALPVFAQSAAAPAAPAAAPRAGGAETVADAPLPSDPRLITGELPNGLKYIVRQHDNPPGRSAVWLHVSAGSLNETDRQRGIAHYLEHMAFNGSKNFKPGTVIDFFQSLGLNFGQHQNAFTSFDQTSYQLFLPNNQPETLQKAMLFMSDVAFRMLLLPAEIEEERQIILEERRTRLSGRQRVQEYFLERLAPGSLFGYRLPIGVEETIRGVQEADFRDYYSRWYQPSNMTLMVVADLDPAVVVEQIKANFAEGAKAAKPKDQDIGVKPYTETRAVIASDKEITDASIGMQWLYEPQAPTTTKALYRRDLVDQIATWAFNRRVQQRVAEGKAAFLGGGAASDDLFRAGFTASASFRTEPDKWEQSLRDAAVELRRVNLHGFTEQEVADARKELLSGAERYLETEKTMPARSMLGLYNDAIANETPIMSAEQELALHRELLPGITAGEVSKRFNQLFNAEKPVTFTLQLPGTAKAPTEAELVSLGQQALAVKPEAETQAARPESLLSKLPEPGKVVQSALHEPSKVTTARLDNGVVVHHRFMDYRKDDVAVTITLAAGEMMETKDVRGVTFASALAWNRPATSTLTSTNIRDIMTGRKVSVRGGPSGPDTTTLTVSGSPKELELGLQLAHLMLTDPKIEKPSFDQFKTGARIAIAQRAKDIQSYAMGEVLPRMIYPEAEARFMPLTVENVDAMTLETAQKWLSERILSAPIEVSVVGEIDKDQAMALVARYVGSLPKRAPVSNTLMADLRKVARPQGPLDKAETFATATDKAMVGGGFFGPDSSSVKEVRLMQVASRILSTRAIQEIREKRQLAYSPGARFAPSPAIPGYSQFTLVSSTEPSKVEGFRKAIVEMFDAFAKDGPTEDEMVTVRKQFANTWDEQMREPSYWSQVLGTLGMRWLTLDDVVGGPEEFQKFTAAEVREVFAKYYTPERRYMMSVVPKAEAAKPEPKADASK